MRALRFVLRLLLRPVLRRRPPRADVPVATPQRSTVDMWPGVTPSVEAPSIDLQRLTLRDQELMFLAYESHVKAESLVTELSAGDLTKSAFLQTFAEESRRRGQQIVADIARRQRLEHDDAAGR